MFLLLFQPFISLYILNFVNTSICHSWELKSWNGTQKARMDIEFHILRKFCYVLSLNLQTHMLTDQMYISTQYIHFSYLWFFFKTLKL